MSLIPENANRDYLVHELRHVLLAMQATRRMLIRGDDEVPAMIELQKNSMERIQGLIELLAAGESKDRCKTSAADKEHHA